MLTNDPIFSAFIIVGWLGNAIMAVALVWSCISRLRNNEVAGRRKRELENG